MRTLTEYTKNELVQKDVAQQLAALAERLRKNDNAVMIGIKELTLELNNENLRDN